jgi:hypothetical protein
MCTLDSCVEKTSWPSARVTLRGEHVMHLLTTGVFSMRKICVAPESAIASVVRRVTFAVARACVGKDRGLIGVADVFEVTTVMSSLLQAVGVAAAHWVGYDVLLAELT